MLRAAHCPGSDPVSFALIRGERAAAFPALAGWSALDRARRAVAEHAAWFDTLGARRAHNRRALGLVLTAARAALLLEGLREGEPALPLTVAATGARLAERTGEPIALEAAETYRATHLEEGWPPRGLVAAAGALVRSLPAYETGRSNRSLEARPASP